MSFATNGSNEIWWDTAGEGEPLLLAMGHAWDARMWWRALPALSEKHRVLRFDNRGIGRTHWDGKPFGISDLAADAFAVMDAAGVESAHVYGMSMGGLTVQEMALAQPGRVRSLVLGCTAAFSADAPRHSRLEPLKARMPVRLVARLLPSALYGPRADPGAVAEDVCLMRSANEPAVGKLAQSRAIARYHSLERIHQIAAPTLVVHGTHDKALSLDRAHELADRIPRAELVVLKDAGHNYLADSPDTATPAVLAFLSRHAEALGQSQQG